MTREDFELFTAMPLAFETIGLERSNAWEPYFCTPEGAELVGAIGCDGVHFVLLPGDERVFCVDPAMGEPGTYVLPVGEDFRSFLSYILFCRNANPLSQIWWMQEPQFRALLEEDARAAWPGCEEYLAEQKRTLETVAKAFALVPVGPFGRVKAMQAAFDPEGLHFSDAYYDVLGIERD